MGNQRPERANKGEQQMQWSQCMARFEFCLCRYCNCMWMKEVPLTVDERKSDDGLSHRI
jgi:hypothetical protein